ncbi:hypothetical protein [Pseudonocardia sp.]|jgi:hypothetical protein|uniref:hypothetical protein n=1 Tax=Pseudonocardia sp. TaxID=60912 RepID=UPI00262294DA|nr:hypothetical protein [Pseudonocardia sp.]MCW2719193.1 hypothetical protein [Pseudonocardia sp.]MDT7616895.1 hypothetical protein [Pseudonocardiales bacterium]
MTAPTDQIAAIAQRSQDATTAAVRTWTESLQHYALSFSAENPLPAATEIHTVVDTWFDLAANLLTAQKALVATLIDAGTEATDTLGEQARTAAAAFTPVTAATEAPRRARATRNGPAASAPPA